MNLKSKRYKILFYLTLLFLIGYIPTTSFVNKRWKRITFVNFQDGTNVLVDEYHSDPRAIVIPEIFGIQFGKDKKDEYRWTKNEINYIRKTYYIPIVIDEYEGIPYMVEFDRETDFPRCFLNLYKYKEGKWEEIDYTRFPKSIAIQNKWLNKNDIEMLNRMDPEDHDFRVYSLTAKLWILLETGKQYYESERDYTTPPTFFAEFKDKYITRKTEPEKDTTPDEKEPINSDRVESPD